MTTEPKRYSAKEAMHWMIDHPSESMRETNYERFYCFTDGEFVFLDLSITDEQRWERVGRFTSIPSLMITSEHNAWQAAIAAEKAQEDDKAPKEGESLHDYMKRGTGLQDLDHHIFHSYQQWIDANYQRKEGR